MELTLLLIYNLFFSSTSETLALSMGAATISQLFTRPVLRLSPYRTSAKGVYICSSSTPPGGGVHGICGYYAARRALKDLFNIHLPWL